MKKIIFSLGLFAFLAAATNVKGEEVADITISADKVQFLYDIKEFSVKAGQKVKLTLKNPSAQPHNLVIAKPGSEGAVIAAATTAMGNPKYMTEMQAVPESDAILFHTKLVQANQEDVLEFTAPEEPGDYPYICTFPGHFVLMKGVMKVE